MSEVTKEVEQVNVQEIIRGTQIEPEPTPQPVVEKPLLQRVAEFKEEAPVKSADELKESFLHKFDINKIHQVTDPEQRANLLSAYSQMQADYTRKTQELADVRKQSKQPEYQDWSPERVQKLLDDPKFVQAAQKVASVETDEYSSLTPEEKAEIRSLKEQNHAVMQQMSMLEKQKQDELLRTKYPDYAPDVVDTTINKLINGEIRATREDIHKLVNFESYIDRAYKYGKQDGAKERSERMDASSLDGKQVMSGGEELGLDSSKSHSSNWDKIKMNILKQMQTGNTKK